MICSIFIITNIIKVKKKCNMNPEISVIVPVYNVEKYLCSCIDSILAQTFTDFELLLIDDGSKDKSGKICDEYARKDRRVKVFHKENGGVSSARNLGIDESNGEYLFFVDSDDIISSSYIDLFVNCIRKNDSVCVVCKYTNRLSLLKNQVDSVKIKEMTSSEFLDEIWISEGKLDGYLWNKIFKRKFLIDFNIRFDEKVSIWEDMLFVVEYFINISTVVFVDAVLYYYRDTINSAVKQHDTSKKIEKISVCLRMLGLDNDSMLYKQRLNGILSDCLFSFLKDFLLFRNKLYHVSMKNIISEQLLNNNGITCLTYKNRLLIYLLSKII